MTIPISNIVDVDNQLTTLPVALQGFGTLQFLTDETPVSVFPLEERIRSYSSILAVATDWSLTSEVYAAASAYFRRGATVFTVGLVSTVTTSATLKGGAHADLATLQAITAGGFTIGINGVETEITGVDFSAAIDLDEVAATLEAAISDVTVTYDLSETQFVIATIAIGADRRIAFATDDIAGLADALGIRAISGGAIIKAVSPETPAVSASIILEIEPTTTGYVLHKKWRDSQAALEMGQFAEDNKKLFFNVSNDARCLNKSSTTHIGYKLKALNFNYTLTSFSSHYVQYPAASIAGRAFIVNFEGSNTVISLFLKQGNEITAEQLTVAEKEALELNNVNAFMSIANKNVYSDSRMASGRWFDTIHGITWLENRIETDVFNLIYGTSTSIALTDAGMSKVYQKVENGLRQAVTNGLVGPGNDEDGNYLPLGYEITITPISQLSADNKARRFYDGISYKAVGAGALHGAVIKGSFTE